MSLLLLKPELDQWKPGEHTGTFRGNNLAFVAATQAFNYWKTDDLTKAIETKSILVKEKLQEIKEAHTDLQLSVRGRGLIFGLEVPARGLATEISKEAFSNGLVIEVSGARDDVLKLIPPLIIDDSDLEKGISIINQSIESVVKKQGEKVMI